MSVQKLGREIYLADDDPHHHQQATLDCACCEFNQPSALNFRSISLKPRFGEREEGAPFVSPNPMSLELAALSVGFRDSTQGLWVKNSTLRFYLPSDFLSYNLDQNNLQLSALHRPQFG